jgi:hypothetical protein
MGMHHGYLAATCSLEDLLRELSAETGELVLSGDLQPTGEIAMDATDDGWTMPAGEHDGAAYILDSSYLLSDQPDMIIRLSEKLGVVIGCGAETVSGSFYLTVARDGEPRRFLWLLHAGMTRGMAMGEPMSWEDSLPLDDIDGEGILAAMREAGLDPLPWITQGRARTLLYTGARDPEGGQMSVIRNEHYERFKRPEDEWLSEIKVVVRTPDKS